LALACSALIAGGGGQPGRRVGGLGFRGRLGVGRRRIRCGRDQRQRRRLVGVDVAADGYGDAAAEAQQHRDARDDQDYLDAALLVVGCIGRR
jgi:hypothetical protein